MKFEYVGIKVYNEKKEEVEVNSYGGEQVKNGSVVDLNDFYTSKAMLNKNYRLIKPRSKADKKVSEVSETDKLEQD